MKIQGLVETPQRIYGKRTDYAETILSEELGEKYIEYRKNWLKASRREIVTDFPLYIQIEHSGKCNLHCPMCLQGVESLRKDYSHGFSPLSIETYNKVLAEAKRYDCPSISFHNNDEPLLIRDLETRIKLAKEAGFFDIIVVTNATLLTRERTRKLLKSGVTKMNFSVDGWNEESYEQVRRGGDFNTVLRNVEYFLEEKRRANLRLPITRATCVLNKFTYKDIDKFREFWGRRVDMVEFQNFQAIRGYTESLKPDGALVNKGFVCNAPWQQVVIRANGDVLPCCSFYGVELVVGNIKNSSIYEIWHSNEMKRIRGELSNNNFSFSPLCKTCSETFYTFNKRKDK
jgi:radical SAM protein with 4Fe4S-binding SPASM domain